MTHNNLIKQNSLEVLFGLEHALWKAFWYSVYCALDLTAIQSGLLLFIRERRKRQRVNIIKGSSDQKKIFA